jgi:3'-phosphoadenosine 5'-phosphosulfate sulfotransferase (PAPS reductase)/FAD synthetase
MVSNYEERRHERQKQIAVAEARRAAYRAARHNPLKPDIWTVTPARVVAALTGEQREQRVRKLVEQAHMIVDQAISRHILNEERRVAAEVILFSGGNDSTVLAHLMRGRADYAAHCNTTIGIEQTRQFVRDTCSAWGLELLERIAPISYRELVIGHGFPGPGHHFKMYQRLKERPMRLIRQELVKDPRRERVVFIAGRRRSESARRTGIPLADRVGSIVFTSPLAMWTSLDMNTYRLIHRDSDPVPVNEVSELLHMSGECLCGSFAKENELEEIRLWFPDVAQEIDEIRVEVRAAGHKYPRDTWGNRAGAATTKTGMLCSSCDFTVADALIPKPDEESA